MPFKIQNPSSKNAPLDSNGKPLLILNVGTGLDISIKDLSQKIAKFSNFKGQILWDKSKPDGTPKKLLNITKIRQLGWQPSIDLDTGIIRTLREFSQKDNF